MDRRQGPHADSAPTHGSVWVWLLVLLAGVYGGLLRSRPGRPADRHPRARPEGEHPAGQRGEERAGGLVNGVAAVVFLVFSDIAWAAAGLIAAGSVIGGQVGATVGEAAALTGVPGFVAVVGVAAIVGLTGLRAALRVEMPEHCRRDARHLGVHDLASRPQEPGVSTPDGRLDPKNRGWTPRSWHLKAWGEWARSGEGVAQPALHLPVRLVPDVFAGQEHVVHGSLQPDDRHVRASWWDHFAICLTSSTMSCWPRPRSTPAARYSEPSTASGRGRPRRYPGAPRGGRSVSRAASRHGRGSSPGASTSVRSPTRPGSLSGSPPRTCRRRSRNERTAGGRRAG